MEVDDNQDVIHIEEHEPDQEQDLNNDRKLSAILEVVPDVQPAHVLVLLDEFEGVISSVVEHLLSEDNDYPKILVKKNGKGKKRARSEDLTDEDKEVPWKMTTDWWNLDARKEGSQEYEKLALEQLYTEFDRIHKNIVKKTFVSNSSFYAPTYSALRILSAQTDEKRGWSFLKKSRASLDKGKTSMTNGVLNELSKEAVDAMKKAEIDEKQAVLDETERQLEEEASGAGLLLECPNCYDEVRFETMAQCDEAHLYCKECTIANANNSITLGRSILPCLQGDCTAVFNYSQVEKILSSSAMLALEKLKVQNEIDSAGLDQLEKCPFCDFAICIDNENERLFTCLNDACQIISCRKCKRYEHLPKTCEEMERDSTIHSVADAMSAALIRSCPKCSQVYLKDTGCNYITCTRCHSGSCYVCEKLCRKDESHFSMVYPHGGMVQPQASGSSSVSKCPLFDTDNSFERDQKNVEKAKLEASEKALAYTSQSNSESLQAEIDKLDVDTKAPPPPDPWAAYGGYQAYRIQQDENFRLANEKALEAINELEKEREEALKKEKVVKKKKAPSPRKVVEKKVELPPPAKRRRRA